MATDQQRYIALLHQFKCISQIHIDDIVITKLKEEYKDKIIFKRALETINNINDLLKVLEKRGVLQYDNINVLKYISQKYIKSKSLEELILDYDQWLQENNSTINNLYSCAIVPNTDPIVITPEVISKMPFFNSSANTEILSESTLRPTINEQYHTFSSTPSVDREKQLQEIVINKVSKKIGKFWTDVSRYLNLEESEIEEIEIKYFDQPRCFEIMFKKALEIYFSEPRSNWKIELMQALDSSRRRDLKEMVEEIIHQQNL